MRINVYAEEITDRVSLIKETHDDREFYGVRFYTSPRVGLHMSGKDDDTGAVTFWVPTTQMTGQQPHKLAYIFTRALQLLAAVK